MNMKLTYEQKLQLAQWISINNCGAITGSIMLKERGLDLGREPKDIDIIIEDTDPDDIELPPCCYGRTEEVSGDGYPILCRVYFYGCKIEFITVPKVIFDIVLRGEEHYKLAKVEDLLKAKKEYLLLDTNPVYLEKTRKDIEKIEAWLTTQK